ncbi:hypothetical protein [Burkholderia contaminans]|uniref:hypothetical protein n=1 Tax=Burkholderia contaminans TaxID=488447 RepID=UPI000F58E245|nr:hypothetical protein [Burkholderia contaminans]ELK6465620.1 hypothetical protein [Burkholderia contaminans]
MKALLAMGLIAVDREKGSHLGKVISFQMLSDRGENPLNGGRLNDLILALSPWMTPDEERSTDELGVDCTGGSTTV